MKRVVVDMRNKLFSDAISDVLHRFDSEYVVYQRDGTTSVEELCRDVRANILILEVTAYAPWQLDTQLALRHRLRTLCPECRVALVVDEVHERPLADKVRRAKKDGLIDGFIYGSVSSAYLSAVIDTL